MTAVLPPAIETGCEHGSSDMKNRAEKRVTENQQASSHRQENPPRSSKNKAMARRQRRARIGAGKNVSGRPVA